MFWFLCAEAQAQLRFEPLVISSNLVRLSLLADSGTNYIIESSADLAHWAGVASGMAENGRFEVDLELGVFGRMFYRARPDTGGDPGGGFDVTPVLWTNYSAALIATTVESHSRIYATNRTEFTLTFPSNTVPEVLNGRMTLITNLTGLPFSGPVIGAVQISMNDDEMLGAALLTITFTNVDRRKIVSFTAGTNGLDFYMVPDRVSSNRVMIPVTGSGIYGACLATTQEVAAVLATINGTAGGFVESSGEGQLASQSIMRTSRLCFPQEVTRANVIRSRIDRAIRRLRANLAAQISAQRQAQLVGEGEDSSAVLGEAARLACELYQHEIASHWAEAAQNCPLMATLLQYAVSLDRQLQLIGVEERCTSNVLSPELLCPGFKKCLAEIRACCVGHPGRDRMRDLVSLIRQQQLLGITGQRALGCYDMGDAAVKEVIEICTPHIWTGSLTVKEKGEDYRHELFVTGYQEETDSYDANFHGFVSQASELNFGPFVQATLYVEGPFVAREFHDEHAVTYNRCGPHVYREISTATVNQNCYYLVNINVQTNGSYSISIAFSGVDPNKPLPPVGEKWNETIRTVGPRDPDCGGYGREMYSDRGEINFLGKSDQRTGQGASPNIIEGRTTGHSFVGGLITDLEIEWRFQRRVRQ